jgi:hypothetical protein
MGWVDAVRCPQNGTDSATLKMGICLKTLLLIEFVLQFSCSPTRMTRRKVRTRDSIATEQESEYRALNFLTRQIIEYSYSRYLASASAMVCVGKTEEPFSFGAVVCISSSYRRRAICFLLFD